MHARASDVVRVGTREIPITHADRVVFPRPKVTKLDLARYYAAVAEAMIPLVRGRPLALQAFPKGIEGEGYFMKSIPPYFPDWIARATVPKKGGTLTQVLADEAATLVYLAGQNVITPHVWLSRADRPHQPDRLTFDLDPAPGVTFANVRAAARAAGDVLRDAGLAPHAMLTGSRGVHVVCPLRRGADFETVHGYARRIGEQLVAEDPSHLTLEWRKADRGRRIYVDVNRINYAQHAVAPYGVRPRSGAPVAIPIHWEELNDPKLRPDRWTTRSAPGRLASDGDAWRGMSRHARNLPKDVSRRPAAAFAGSARSGRRRAARR